MTSEDWRDIFNMDNLSKCKFCGKLIKGIPYNGTYCNEECFDNMYKKIRGRRIVRK